MRVARARRAEAIAIAAGVAGLAAAASAADHSLTLEEAIALALQNNSGIIIDREARQAAAAAVDGAHGAYDPLLGLAADWVESNPPVNSAFSGAPAGRLTPTNETIEGYGSLSKLLRTGGTVTIDGGTDRNETDGVFGLLSPAYGSHAGVELRQPLLRNLTIDPARFRIRAAEADLGFADAGLREQVSETVAVVEQTYWTLLSQLRQVEVREEAVRLAEEQRTETEARIESGMAPEKEIAQPRAEVERRRGELIEARQGATRAENTLKLLILGEGTEADVALWSDRLVPADPAAVTQEVPDAAAAMERALASRPELRAFQAVLERRNAEAALAKDAVKPALDAVLGYQRFGLAGRANPAAQPFPGQPSEVPPELEGGQGDALNALFDGDFDEARVGLAFGFPLRNREARANLEIARSAERQAEADLSRLRKVIRTEVLDAIAALDTAGQRIESARAAREAAEVQLESERERYGAGMSTNFLVLTRQNDLSAARLEEIDATTDYRRARTALARITGTLLDERGVTVETTNPTEEKAP
jgi:outer membrane protein TolC